MPQAPAHVLKITGSGQPDRNSGKQDDCHQGVNWLKQTPVQFPASLPPSAPAVAQQHVDRLQAANMAPVSLICLQSAFNLLSLISVSILTPFTPAECTRRVRILAKAV